MTQDELKQAVAKKAIDYIVDGEIIGVGTGSTANFFIDELAKVKDRIRGTVASSEATAQRLKGHGIPVLDLNEVESMPVYIDGADEITSEGYMIKGGGAALTREKIVASVAKRFICIADASKLVVELGKFPLPVEVVPMSWAVVSRQITAEFGGKPVLRLKDGKPLVTDNGGYILDIHDLRIPNPPAMETGINNIAGVITNGLFARQNASVCLLGRENGVQVLDF